jgi:hypothetical protein
MDLLDILQSSQFESLYENAHSYEEYFTLDKFDEVEMNTRRSMSELINSLTDEQKRMAENFFSVNVQYERLIGIREFRRGFKLAMELMMETIS